MSVHGTHGTGSWFLQSGWHTARQSAKRTSNNNFMTKEIDVECGLLLIFRAGYGRKIPRQGERFALVCR